MLAAYYAHLLGAMGNLFSTARHADNLLAMDRVFHLIHVWALISDSVGFMGAQRLMRSCVAANKGAREYLEKLPHLVVYGGYMELEYDIFLPGGKFLGPPSRQTGTPRSRKVWGLDPLTLRWNERAELLVGRSHHACCEVRGRVVILSGVEEWRSGDRGPATVEMCGDDDVFHRFPSLSAGHLCAVGTAVGTVAVEIVETDSESGQVLLIGGWSPDNVALRTVYAVDIATGQCTPQPSMIHARAHCAAARLPDGSVICAGGELGRHASVSAEILYPGASAWALLPDMRVPRSRFSACVMSDGRFAVFGGSGDVATTSCEVLSLGNGAPQWKPLPAMNYPREAHACVAFAGCVFVVGGESNNFASVYDEAKRKWFELPHALPRQLGHMGGVIIPRHPPIRRVT